MSILQAIALLLSIISLGISIATFNNISKTEKMLDEYEKQTRETALKFKGVYNDRS